LSFFKHFQFQLLKIIILGRLKQITILGRLREEDSEFSIPAWVTKQDTVSKKFFLIIIILPTTKSQAQVFKEH
jgi:hypothetical protein